MKSTRLGDLLIEKNLIGAVELQKAIDLQNKTDRKLGQILIEEGYVEKTEMLSALAEHLGVSFIDLQYHTLPNRIKNTLPESIARRNEAIVLDEKANEVLVGIADPSNIFACDEITAAIKKPVTFALVPREDVVNAIEKVYHHEGEISVFAEEISLELNAYEINLEDNFDISDGQSPLNKLLNTILSDAIESFASDIHIEPDNKDVRIRLRIDGMLQERVIKDHRVAVALAQRLKLLAGLDIAEKRLPQDGRFHFEVNSKKVDIRLSTMPIQDGESVVMRLLQEEQSHLTLEECGLPSHILTKFRKIIHQPHGIVLVTGPTGSGKTTTLYSALTELNSVEKKVITIEDPVEYRMPLINQVQINEKISLDFSTVLKAILRQDPDIIMLGEIRDQMTASIAMRAAVTGHLLLATIHTNDTISTMERLLDMGVESYLMASAIRGILAQRLVRKLCTFCTEEFTPDQKQLDLLNYFSNHIRIPNVLYGSKGCHHCHNTGYTGRIGIYELLVIDDAMSSCLRKGDLQGFIEAAHFSRQSRTLAYGALDAATRGLTSIEEVFRIVGELENDLDLEVDILKHKEDDQRHA